MMYAAPEEAGWSSTKLAEARAYYDEIDSAAVMIVYDGAVLAAWGDVSRRYMCHSVRKSFLSGLYGVHVAGGNIDLGATLAELKIDDDPPLSDGEKRARVADLLASRSGVYHPAAYETAKMKEQRPPRDSRKPGELFWYNNWDFNTLSTIFRQQSESDVFEEFGRRFAEPLAMQDYRVRDGYYHLEPQHSIHPAYPFRMSARDMARFGLLYLRGGRWGDRCVLTERWVEQSTASHFRKSDTTSNSQYAYGYLWWPIADGPLQPLKMFSARGYGGHAIDVLPGANLVLVHRVDTFWDLAHFDRPERRVKDSERFKLLDLILQARIGPPKRRAKLVPGPDAPKAPRPVEIPPGVLKRYAVEYDFGEFRTRVRLVGNELLLSAARTGQFALLPRSATEFVIEDVEAAVRFEVEDGRPQTMAVEFSPGEFTAGRFVGDRAADDQRKGTP